MDGTSLDEDRNVTRGSRNRDIAYRPSRAMAMPRRLQMPCGIGVRQSVRVAHGVAGGLPLGLAEEDSPHCRRAALAATVPTVE